MAFSIVTTGGSGRDINTLGKSVNYREFVLDSAADVSQLPTSTSAVDGAVAAVGSVAYTADGSAAWILSPSDTWTEVK